MLFCFPALKGVPPEQREKEQRAFVNAGSDEKDTALHVAAQAGYEETVRTLVSIGANVNMKTDTQSTPLHLAAIGGQLSVVRFLVQSANAILKASLSCPMLEISVGALVASKILSVPFTKLV